MSACIDTNITMKGSLEELLDMIKVLEDSKYLSGHMIKKKYIKDISEEELKKLIEDSNNEITIYMMGPYGIFEELSNTKVFETLADVSPNAYFTGTMEGFTGSSNVSLTGKLENKKLYLSYSDTSSVGGYESYMKYLDKVFPKKKFCKLFKIDLDDLDEEATVLLSRRITYLKRLKNEEVVIVDKNEFIIGKSSTCDYKVEGNPSISRQHAKITCKEGVYYLEDLNSLNHTSINGENISGLVEIDDQTTFKLADEEFSFFISEE